MAAGCAASAFAGFRPGRAVGLPLLHDLADLLVPALERVLPVVDEEGDISVAGKLLEPEAGGGEEVVAVNPQVFCTSRAARQLLVLVHTRILLKVRPNDLLRVFSC